MIDILLPDLGGRVLFRREEMNKEELQELIDRSSIREEDDAEDMAGGDTNVQYKKTLEVTIK